MKGSRMTYSAKKGFTIIEIMIVIMIIGVLAAGAFGGMRYLQRVKRSNAKMQLAKVDVMIEEYLTAVGEYPTDLQELVDGPSKPQLQRRWSGPLATESELRDPWQMDFVYSLNPRGAQYPFELYSTGPKGDEQIFSPRSGG